MVIPMGLSSVDRGGNGRGNAEQTTKVAVLVLWPE